MYLAEYLAYSRCSVHATALSHFFLQKERPDTKTYKTISYTATALRVPEVQKELKMAKNRKF